MMKIYETDRLYLREIDESYAETVLQYYDRNREFLKAWEEYRPDDFFTLDYQKKKLQKDRKEFEEGKIIRLWIFKKGDDTKIIGCISFNLIVRGIYQSCVLGYKLDKAELNKGYTTEALRKAIQVAFEEFQLHRIEAPIMPRNLASIQVVTKIGFQYEGVSRKMLMVNGVWEDHMRWVLLNE
ncbi:GNAT family protein [Bacillus thuringiensis]|nr:MULTISPECIES: GNAT family protein [Bacillus]KAB2378609.1 GNAT family N-acetyltransferase [Bacillus sp. RM2(2019)]KXY62665.1 alanine acetyltransferase [Bacillus cereus]MBK5493629.1 GNAT family N-acetyltransferase [Bacillus sp. TH13]MCC6079072.1 GNAT family N-acetyltransferase [Bacillus thuringiensis]MCR6782181.1 GNAT family N-acetyltransferase [Bacillus thuringiensis]